MNPWTVLRRAFAANPRVVPVGPRESEALQSREIVDPTLHVYLAWRRGLLAFVVAAAGFSAALATYREYTEADERGDLLETIAEHLPLAEELTEESDDEEESPDEEVESTDEKAGAQEDEDAEASDAEPPQNAFATFTDYVQLSALHALPVAALAACLFWTRYQFSFYMLLLAFAFSFLTPMIIALCPWSWWGYVEPVYDPRTRPLEYPELKAEGLLEGAAYLVTLLPTVLSLVPGVQRACIRVKLLLPNSELPGWFLVTASPFYALFLFVVFVVINQFDTHWLLFVGMLLFLAAPLTYVVRRDLVTRPAASADDERSIRTLQRMTGLLVAIAGLLMVSYLGTREAFGVRLLGLDYETSLLVPWDAVEFLLETLSRSMFITVLGADLFMRMNVAAWKNSRGFAGSPAERRYDEAMSEFARIA